MSLLRTVSLVAFGAVLHTGALVASVEAKTTAAHRATATSSQNANKANARTRLPTTTVDIMPVGGDPASSAKPEGSTGASGGAGVAPSAIGSASERWPYSTARVAVQKGGFNGKINTPVTGLPYRLTGKLWMRFGGSWFVCTASLIKPRVLITAAHCVHDYGQGNAGFADEVQWYPANTTSGGGPYGMFSGLEWRVPTPYLNGTDTCQAGANGVVCNNDIATVVLNERSGQTAEQELGGTYDYGWNGYSYVQSPAFGNATIADISQLGYPVAFDEGYQMQRNNSFGKYIAGPGSNGQQLRNTQLGSALTGGSSGGPWLVNFGTKPKVSNSGSLGSQADINVVVGVTSWGYTSVGVNVQGASWFGQNAEFPNANYGGYGAGNIGKLVQDTCTAHPTAC